MAVPERLSELLAEMDALVEGYRYDGDRSGYFAAMYRCVTREVARRCEAGGFDDSERMVEFASAFARRYLDAAHARRAGRPTTNSWATAFDASRRWKPVVLQHLMLGMNAHINLDLGVVTAELGDTYGIDQMAGDFRRINDLLASMVESCQRGVSDVSPWMGLLDRMGGRTDTVFVRFSLVRARDVAWHTAQRLAPLPTAARRDAIEQLDQDVARLGALVLDGPLPVDLALVAVRLRERRHVRDVIDRLTTATASR